MHDGFQVRVAELEEILHMLNRHCGSSPGIFKLMIEVEAESRWQSREVDKFETWNLKLRSKNDAAKLNELIAGVKQCL